MHAWMYTLMTELRIKIKNTHIKYLIMKWAVVTKRLKNKYVQENIF